MSERGAYARAGVDQGDRRLGGRGAGRSAGARSTSGATRARSPLPGHYASVIRIDERTGIALSTDGVGTKLRSPSSSAATTRVGIDCVAMNVNDVICVGAEPLAMLDYIAVEKADPEVCRQIGVGLARGAELAGIEIPGGELAQLGEMVARLRPRRRLLRRRRASTRSSTASAVEPGDPVIGLPSSGIHSNGYTLARRALEGIPLDDERLGAPLGDVLLEPTEIYVRAGARAAALGCRGARPRPHHLRRARQPAAAARRGRLRDRRPAAGAARLRADPGARRRSPTTRCTRSSTWAAASAASSRPATRRRRWSLLRGHYPGGEADRPRRRGRARGPSRRLSALLRSPRADRDPDLREAHGARRDRPLRGAALGPRLGGPLRRPRGRAGARRQRRPGAGRRPLDRRGDRARHRAGRRRRGQPAAARATSGCSAGCATSTERPAGRPRSAPARWSSARPACWRESARPSHWLYLEPLREYGAEPTSERVVEDGKVITAAGVSSGIDMALHLVDREVGPEAAQAVQLAIEYDPEPPFDSGSPAKAPRRDRRRGAPVRARPATRYSAPET